MITTVRKLSEEEIGLVKSLDLIMESKQSEIDSLLEQYQGLMGPVLAIQEEIRIKRKDLAPISKMKASLVSQGSRDKYFPEESKLSMTQKVRKEINSWTSNK